MTETEARADGGRMMLLERYMKKLESDDSIYIEDDHPYSGLLEEE